MDPALLYDVGELGILGQKSVAWVDGGSASDLRRTDQRGDVVVALACRGRADAHLLVRKADVKGIRVGGGMDRDGSQPHVAAGANHAQGDFAPVGYQYFLEHGDGAFGFTTEGR